MKKYAGFRNGYVRVRIYGEETERFLNLCRAREIRISDLRRVCRSEIFSDSLQYIEKQK